MDQKSLDQSGETISEIEIESFKRFLETMRKLALISIIVYAGAVLLSVLVLLLPEGSAYRPFALDIITYGTISILYGFLCLGAFWCHTYIGDRLYSSKK